MTKNVKVNYKANASKSISPIIFVGGGIFLVGACVALVLLLTKKEVKPPINNDKPGGDIVVVNPTDDVVTTPVNKVNNTEKKTIYRTVTFYYGTKSHTVKVVDGNKVNKYLPTGYTNCEYYSDSGYNNLFNFNNKITKNTVIYIKSLITTYTVIYNLGNHGNPLEYSIDLGDIDLDDPIVDNIFLGWFLDNEHTNRVEKLSGEIISLANENNEIYLYGYTTDSVTVNYYDRDGALVDTVNVVDSNTVSIDNHSELAAPDEQLYGYSDTKDNVIEHHSGEVLELTSEEVSLYAVTAVSKVEYENNGEVVAEVGYNDSELENYVLPTDEDLDLEAPTYFDFVQDETMESLVIVENDKDEVLDTEIKLSDVEGHTGDWYVPQVGDNVIEKEMVFDGWSQVVHDDLTNEDNLVPVDDDYKPPKGEEVTLVAEWTYDEPLEIEVS